MDNDEAAMLADGSDEIEAGQLHDSLLESTVATYDHLFIISSASQILLKFMALVYLVLGHAVVASFISDDNNKGKDMESLTPQHKKTRNL